MKNLLIITSLSVVFSLLSCSEKSENNKVPENVLSAFKTEFPDAINVAWEMEDAKEWEAVFIMNEKEYSANYSINGEWNETEYEIIESEVPSEILLILSENFEDYDIEKVEITETAAGKSYEFEINVGDEEIEVVIDTDGNLTKKVEREEEGNE